jgi:putative ABC transport system permease protein
VVIRGLLIAMLGAAIGVGAAFELTRGLSGMLYNVSATDPAVFVAVPLLLIIVTMVASYIPARKATHIDPMVALRFE